MSDYEIGTPPSISRNPTSPLKQRFLDLPSPGHYFRTTKTGASYIRQWAHQTLGKGVVITRTLAPRFEGDTQTIGVWRAASTYSDSTI